MATPGDKTGAEHVDHIAAASSTPSVQGAPLEKQDTAATGDEIVQNLNQAGEEVGMTWRSILAAGVSELRQPKPNDRSFVFEKLTWLTAVYGFLL